MAALPGGGSERGMLPESADDADKKWDPEGGNQGDIWTALRRTETLGLRRESMRRTLEVAAAILGPKVPRTE
ncbi:hypothetical protein NDU88_003205 [Pleurodeles waltl]|uniref:Uncharacterized protein n=1 Tax=Pleurodeles waltl TaxID=8319 RepID=A0AAV7NG62_PLEWA|nr:hypothetical protein NDU88_003205 [Pleurodeles waltl]